MEQRTSAPFRLQSVPQTISDWFEASAITGNDVPVDLGYAIEGLMAFLLNLSSFNKNSTEKLDPLLLAKEIDSWLRSARGLDYQQDLLRTSLYDFAKSISNQSREARLKAINVEILECRASMRDRHSVDLICGFLVSLIDPGSLDFFDFARKINSSYGVILSYALCAGLLAGMGILSRDAGFGFSIYAKGLAENRFRPAAGDVSLIELRILKPLIKESGFEFRTKTPAALEVELSYGVVAAFGNGLRKIATGGRTGSEDIKSDFVNERLAQSINAARDLLRDLEALEALTVDKRNKRRSN